MKIQFDINFFFFFKINPSFDGVELVEVLERDSVAGRSLSVTGH